MKPVHTRSTRKDPYFNTEDTQPSRTITPTPRVDSSGARFEIFGLPPGSYTMRLLINAHTQNPNAWPPNGWPGDFVVGHTFKIEKESPLPHLVVNLVKLIRLTSPVDNYARLAVAPFDPFIEELAIRSDSIAVTWDSILEGAEYECVVHRMSHKPFKTLNVVSRKFTQSLSINVPLAPNEEGEFYSLRLNARHNNFPVGFLRMQWKGGAYSADYRFRVVASNASSNRPVEKIPK